uniref:Uncharacterized protein n=2 Tax=Knipowitschia caucasica TaxID=637954 RepID=A0AAV2M537_KNICA
MSAGQTLRVLVTARLSAAAEEIFALFERTIAEYEEELRLCKEKQRRQEQLETLRPRVMLLRADAQSPSRSPGLDLDQKIPETPQIKEEPEEQSIKQEQEQLPEPVPESNALYLKTEEPSLIQQTELREETQGEDFSTETYFLSDTEEDMGNFSDFNHVENHMDSFSCSAAQMEAEAVVDHYHQVQIRTRETTTQNCGTHLYLDNRPETSASVNTGHMRGTVRGAQGKGFQCPFCEKVMKNRALVTARLTAAAEEIFALFERTIAEYEEELRLCKEKQRRQEQLETLRPRVMLPRADAHMPSRSPGISLNQQIPETPQIKEEPEERSIKQEGKQQPEPVPESNAACWKTEESSLLQQTEHGEETQGEDFSTDTFFLPQTEGNFSDFNQVENHMDSFSCSASQMETEADGDHYHQVQLRARETTAQNYGPLFSCSKLFVKMSVGPTLRALVTARLTAAAEDIFALFERTIAEYEEELRLCKEKQRRQEQLETLRPRVMLLRAEDQLHPPSPVLCLDKEIQETPQIKEEPEERSISRNKQEEKQLPEPVPESSAASMKAEESSLLQQTELREETQGEDFSTDTFFLPQEEESFSDFNQVENHMDSFSCSAAQIKSEDDEDHYHQVQLRARETTSQNYSSNLYLDNGPETSASVNTGYFRGTGPGSRGRGFQCPYCEKVMKNSAAAEEIFALFERTIAEYEKELRLCKEKQRRQEQLETLRPRVMLLRADAQTSSQSPGPGLNQEIQETPQIKEEPEEQSIIWEQLPEPVPESSAACWKTEDSSLLQQTELGEETQGEDFSTDTFFLPQTEGNFSDFNNVENHMASFSCSAAQMETEADGDHYHQVQLRARETTAQNGFQCPYCDKFVIMFAGPTLRALVTARLTAAAEEIFALFERTIAEYEEELRLCKEKQRRQEQLETLRPRVMLLRADAQMPYQSPGISLNKKSTETQIKEEPEEQHIKPEEEQLPVHVPESSAVSVKTEESSLLQQTELREETQEENITDFSADNDQFVKMSAGPTLRALVTARLSAAAEEIFALFERTIAEYEEELRLCKEKQRRQEQLETLRPRVMLLRADAQIPPQTPGSGLNKKIPETPQVKEEQSIKREEQLPEYVKVQMKIE